MQGVEDDVQGHEVRSGGGTEPARHARGIAATIGALLVHGFLAVWVVRAFIAAGPHFGTGLKEIGAPPPMFFHDVRAGALFTDAHPRVVWGVLVAVLVLDAGFLVVSHLKKDRALFHIWGWMLTAFFTVLVILITGCLWRVEGSLTKSQFSAGEPGAERPLENPEGGGAVPRQLE